MSEAWFSPGGELPRQKQDEGPSELPEVQLPTSLVYKETATGRTPNRVRDTAENNQPIEAEYERSYEVKDTEQAAISFAPMQSVGAILGEQQQAMRPLGDQFVDPNKVAVLQSTSKSVVSVQITLYKRAILYGAISATGASIIILTYLLIK